MLVALNVSLCIRSALCALALLAALEPLGCGSALPAADGARPDATGDLGAPDGKKTDGKKTDGRRADQQQADLGASDQQQADLGASDATKLPEAGAMPDASLTDLPNAGTMMLLSYNVAGLPGGLSQSDPVKNTPLMSPLLNAYDLALMQGDFAFTTQLSSQALHPQKSVPGVPAFGTFMNDGLTRFSNFAFTGHTRVRWQACNGYIDQANDCLASKGFSVARTTLGAGAIVDVYNLHMDAGNSSGDQTARAAQVDQLLAEIATRSVGQAIIIAGDTNINPSKSAKNKQMLDKLLLQANLIDACVHVSCGDVNRIDRVMYRSSPQVQLEALSWQIDTSFVDGAGVALSDHEAVGVQLSWKALVPGGG